MHSPDKHQVSDPLIDAKIGVVSHLADPSFSREVSAAELARKRADLESTFARFYRDNGYEQIASASLVASYDSTLLFTSATIAPLKPRVLAADPETRVFIAQDCFRAFNLKNAFISESESPKYLSSFRMLGTFSGQTEVTTVVQELLDYLKKVGVGKEEVHFMYRASDGEFHSALPKIVAANRLLVGTQPESFYDWRFGDNSLTGRGLTFCIRRKEDSEAEPYQVGNIVMVDGPTGTLGCEVGVGIEALLAGRESLSTLVPASMMQRVVNPKSVHEVKLADYLEAALLISEEGVTPGHKGHEYVLKKLIRACSYLTLALDVKDETLISWLNEYENLRNGEGQRIANELASWIIKGMNGIQQCCNRFEKVVDKKLATLLTGLSKELGDALLEDAKSTYGVPRPLAAQILVSRGFKFH